MCSQDMGHLVDFEKFVDDAGAKRVSGSPTSISQGVNFARRREARTEEILQSLPSLDRGLTTRGPLWARLVEFLGSGLTP
jgi:hypothetical protein